MSLLCDVTKKITADVTVVGGGTAGVFAAISAAKSGAKTMLVEKNSMIGGTITAANVNFPGLFFAWGKQIISGPCWESIERTIALGGAELPKISFKPEKHWYEQIRLNRFIYTSVLLEMCREAGVIVLTNAMVSAVEEHNNDLYLLITEKTGLIQIETKKAIDATGDANLVVIAGYKVVKSANQQPATLQNHISGYDINAVNFGDIKNNLIHAELPDYINANMLIGYLEMNKIDMHIPCTDADTSAGKTILEQRALSELLKVYKFFRKIKGLENLTIDFIAEETGVRETNRIIGEYEITAEEYINGTLYPDSVCYAFYPIDLHVMEGIKKIFHSENVVAKVPYRALIPKNSKHILCAGRCIASDTYANSGLRVEATCMAMGQAAGCAAAIAAQNNVMVDKVGYKNICEKLKMLGAILPTK